MTDTDETVGRRCATCRWLLKKDYGYSNYTVEGTTWSCLKEANPHFPVDEYDRPRKWKWGNEHGATCETFDRGDPIEIDCDSESAKMRQEWRKDADSKIDTLHRWLDYVEYCDGEDDPRREILNRLDAEGGL